MMPMKVITVLIAVFLCTTTAYSSTHKNVSVRNISNKQRIAATVTAYTPDPRENGGKGKKSGTAIGTRIRPGIVAVSRDLLKSGWNFGDKVHIEGLGVFTIEDTMHQRHSRTIDVAVPNKSEAQKIGKRRAIVVTLLEDRPEAEA
jgi:3D (Asp-Asp-Asp) domain-containing protein